METSIVRRTLMVVALLFGSMHLADGARADGTPAKCIAPAKPGGGYDVTCRIAGAILKDAGLGPVRIAYMPGGIGAVAFNAMVAQTPGDGDAIVAFSSGALLNIATGRFGKYGIEDVEWLAAVGIDHGMIAVSADSPYRSLNDLVAAMRATPRKVLFGAGGSIGSQDWMKAALLARRAGVDRGALRYVAFEGGGEAMAALLAGHVQVVSGDIAEALGLIDTGRIRVLAVLSQERLPGRLATIPTAREQGVDLQWPILRGFYMGAQVADADLRRWRGAFARAATHPDYERTVQAHGMVPIAISGPELDAYVRKDVARYQRLAREFGLPK